MNGIQDQRPFPGEQEINLLELLRVIARRKSIIIRICAVAVIIAACYSMTLKNIYTAGAKVIPPQKESGGGLSALLGQAGGLTALAGMGGMGGMGGLGGGTTDLYLGILKSRSVADAVIKRLDLKTEFEAKTIDDARKKLDAAVRFKAGKDGIISIDADSRDPQKAAQLANTFVDELGRRSVELNLTKAGAERMFLEKRLDMVKQDLRNAENNMKDFAQRNKTFKADSQASVAVEGIAHLKAEIITKEALLASLRNSMTDENSEVKGLMAGIARLKSQLATMTGSGGSDVIPAVGNIPTLSVEYVRKLRELKTQEALFELLAKQYEVAQINEAKDTSSLEVLDEAVVPLKTSKPRRLLIVIITAVTAFFASIIVVFIQEYFSKLSPEDAAIIRDIRASLRFRPHDRQPS